MSLWLVLNSQRTKKPGLWSWWSWRVVVGALPTSSVSFTHRPAGSVLNSCRCQQAQSHRFVPAPAGAASENLVFACVEPGVEFLRRHRAHDDRHPAVVGAADLVALAVEGAGLVGLNQVSIVRPGIA